MTGLLSSGSRTSNALSKFAVFQRFKLPGRRPADREEARGLEVRHDLPAVISAHVRGHVPAHPCHDGLGVGLDWLFHEEHHICGRQECLNALGPGRIRMRSAGRSLDGEDFGDEQFVGLSRGQQLGLEALPLVLLSLGMLRCGNRVAVRVLGERSRHDIRRCCVTPRHPVIRTLSPEHDRQRTRNGSNPIRGWMLMQRLAGVTDMLCRGVCS
jgi:hypothetical protein